MNDAAGHIQLLGGFAVSVGNGTIPDECWRSRRACSLVKLLALAPGHRLHRDQVIEILWPDSDLSAALNNFHQTLYNTRKVFDATGTACLILKDGLLSLEEGLSVDVEQFEAAAAHAKDSPDPAMYQAALALYSGDLLPEDLYEEFTLARRESLRQLHLKLLLDLARLYETRQDYPAGIETLGLALACDRSHEEAHAGLMRLYALSGQRQQALRQYQVLREALQAELAAEPSQQTTQLYEAIQAGRFSPALPPTPAARRHNLPAQLTSFIGREKQIGEIRRLVVDQRLVTLTGTGGTGKTRLALQVGYVLLDSFPDGVFLVELASLSDPDLVPQACVKILNVIEQAGVSHTDALTYFLEKKDLLLILDNCEHLIAACASLADALLKGCPRLHILATSREILSVPGEHPYRVPSLEVPDPGALPPLAELAQVESVRLFIERAGQVVPGAALTSANAASIAQIGQRLDGIPLAIELAAARMRLLTAEQIASGLEDAFHLLTGGGRTLFHRHQTLKALIDWSYDLLTPKERLLLQRLSVFVGGWTLEAAEAVCADEIDAAARREVQLGSFEVLDLLALLVDKSLVIAEPGAHETRYRMLETIRQYARERLVETGGSERVRDRHLAYFLQLAEQAEPHLRGKDMIQWLSRFDDELDNVRMALDWSLVRACEQGLQIMADLMWFWWIRGLFNEGSDWSQKLLAAEAAERGAGALKNGRALQRARGMRVLFILNLNAVLSYSLNDCKAMEDSIAILRQLGPLGRRELGISLLYFSWYQDLILITPAQLHEILDIFSKENDRFYISEYLFMEGMEAGFRGDIDLAITYLDETLAISKEIEDYDGISSRAFRLGEQLTLRGDFDKAENLYTEAIQASRNVHNYWWEMTVFEGLAGIAGARGQYEEAARLGQVILKHYQELHYRSGISRALLICIVAAWAKGDYPRAVCLANKVIEDYPEDWIGRISSNFCLGRVALAQGDLAQAELRIKQTIPFMLNFGPRWLCSHHLGLATLFFKQGRLPQAAHVLGTVDEIYRRFNCVLTLRERVEHDETLALVRAELGEESFTTAWKEGQSLTYEQALAWVSGEMQVNSE